PTQPVGSDPVPLDPHLLNRLGPRQPLPIVPGPTGELRRRPQHEFALDSRQPGVESSRVLRVRRKDDISLHRTLRAWAPCQHDGFESTTLGGEQIEMSDAASPAAPGSVALLANRNAPTAIHRLNPRNRRTEAGGRRESGTDRIEQDLS